MPASSYRKPRPLNREIEHVRDTSLIIIATEDEKTEPLYFEMDCFKHKRIQIRVVSTEEGKSSPKDVLDRLHKEATEYQFGKGDQFWLVIDKDRWTDEMLYKVIDLCEGQDYRLALSNPCFELWLLLHFKKIEELEWEQEPSSCGVVKSVFGPLLDKRDGGNYDATYADFIQQAVEEAKKLDSHPDAPFPDCPGTRVYRLVAELLR